MFNKAVHILLTIIIAPTLFWFPKFKPFTDFFLIEDSQKSWDEPANIKNTAKIICSVNETFLKRILIINNALYLGG